jgi:Rpp20 subunit of nuclear RNase MRP and P
LIDRIFNSGRDEQRFETIRWRSGRAISPDSVYIASLNVKKKLGAFEKKKMIRKRKANHNVAKRTDIYLSKRRPRAIYYKRARSLLLESETESITLHALGAAVPLAAELCAFLQREFGGECKLAARIRTETVQLIDDRVGDDGASEAQEQRFNSAIHICLEKVKTR